MCSRCYRRRPHRCSSARSAGRGSSRIAGISTCTIDRPNAKRTVFESPDLSVTDFTLSPDGTTIWFTAARARGRDNLYRVPIAGGTPQRVVKGGAIGALDPGAAFAHFLEIHAHRAGRNLPRSADAAEPEQALTHENAAWLKDVAIPRTGEPRPCAGAGGTPVQYWLIKPPHFDRVEEVSGGVPDSRRTAGSVGRRVVGALESVAVGGAGMGHRRAEPARLDRLRPEVRRRDHAGLGRQGHDRPRRRRSTRSAKLPFVDAQRIRASPARATAATRWTGSSDTRTGSRRR